MFVSSCRVNENRCGSRVCRGASPHHTSFHSRTASPTLGTQVVIPQSISIRQKTSCHQNDRSTGRMGMWSTRGIIFHLYQPNPRHILAMNELMDEFQQQPFVLDPRSMIPWPPHFLGLHSMSHAAREGAWTSRLADLRHKKWRCALSMNLIILLGNLSTPMVKVTSEERAELKNVRRPP